MKILSNKQYKLIMAVHSAMHRLIAKQEHMIKEQHALIEKQQKQICMLQEQLGVNVDFPNKNEGSKTKQENNTDIFSKF